MKTVSNGIVDWNFVPSTLLRVGQLFGRVASTLFQTLAERVQIELYPHNIIKSFSKRYV